MSQSETGSGKASVKTLAIRLELDLHAQLSIIAQLQGSTITDEIRKAIEAHIEVTKATPELAAKADAVLDELEREADARREALATLFGANDTTSAPKRARGSRKATNEAEARSDDS